MILRRLLIILIPILILCARCAQIGPLSGGKKDVTPPKLLSVLPHDTSVNVPTHNTTIIFTFDEMIDIKTVVASMVVNPLLVDKPDVRASGKKMILSFDDDLDSNTTYQIQFGKSIGDVHENNKYKNLTYIFSTGPTIDSNTVSGRVTWALSLKPAKDVSVMLYTNLDDTAATRTRPKYVVKTDSAGEYSISAIKPGIYQPVAVTDKNNNWVFDLGESIGFVDAPVTITGKDTADFIMSTPKSDKTFIKKKIQPFWGYNKYILSDTLPNAYILLLEDSSKNPDRDSYGDKITYETRKDTLEVYYKGIYDTELKFAFKKDQTAFDTVLLEVPSESKVDSMISKHGKKIGLNVNKRIYGITHDDVALSFSFPIKDIDKDKCILLHDSIQEKLLVTIENINENNNLVTTYLPLYKRRILNRLLESETYTVMVLPNSLTTYWDKTNIDTIKTTFKTYSNEDIGTLKIKLALPDSMHNYVLQLLSAGNKVIDEYSGVVKKENVVTFYNLDAADYSLRLINDLDANKKFTPANFTAHIQPETIYLYTKPIKIPAGWDVENEWNIPSLENKNK
jgi:hypothetical protein